MIRLVGLAPPRLETPTPPDPEDERPLAFTANLSRLPSGPTTSPLTALAGPARALHCPANGRTLLK
jgi:hypothetical protein